MSSWVLETDPNIELRRLGSSDIALVVDLAGRAFNSPVIAAKVEQMLQIYTSTGMITHYLAQQDSMLQVVYYVLVKRDVCGEILLGLTGLYYPVWAGDGVFWLGWFAIDPRYQAQGHGARLLRATIGLAAAKRGRMLCVETSKELDAALGLYTRMGFTYSGEIPNYWGPGSNLLILSRPIDDVPIAQEIPNDL